MGESIFFDLEVGASVEPATSYGPYSITFTWDLVAP